MRISRRALLPTLLLLGLAACGGVPVDEPVFPGGEPSATVIVDNLRTNYLGVIIFAESLTGGTYRLGSVSSSGSTTLPFRDLRQGQYILEARITGQPPIRSREFFLRDGDTVEWNLDDNRVTYR